MKQWNKTTENKMMKAKINSAKSTINKILSNTTKIPADIKKQEKQKKNFVKYDPNKQRVLKTLLEEFGLTQYLKRFFEIGIDDENIFKLCNMTAKDEEQLLNNLKVFPVNVNKFKKFFERIREIFLNQTKSTIKTPLNTTGKIIKKPQSSQRNASNPKRVNSSEIKKSQQIKKVYSSSSKHKEKSHDTKYSNNNAIVQSFVNEQFGFNYYLNDNNIKPYKEITNDSLQDEDLHKELNYLLQYYMAQLNEKIDKEYESDSESSLKDFEFDKIVEKEIEKSKDFKQKTSTNQIVKKDINEISNSEKEPKVSPVNDEDTSLVEKKKTQIKYSPKEKALESKNDLSKDQTGLNKQQDFKTNELNVDKKQTIQSNRVSDEKILHPRNKDENDKLINQSKNEDLKLKDINEEKKTQNTENLNPIKESIQPEKKQFINENKNIPEVVKNEQQEIKIKEKAIQDDEKKLSNSAKLMKNKGQPEDLKKMPELSDFDRTKEEKKKRKTKYEDDDLEDVRIVRSFEDKDLRQNIDQFDIEYMCRCLGLALMKHIEGAKEKTHILDLININEKFDFFSTIFNINFDFFKNFLNLENKISNLEKLDSYYKLTETSGIDIKFFRQSQEKPKEPKVQDTHISYTNHLKYANGPESKPFESTDTQKKVAKIDDSLQENSKILNELHNEIPEEIMEKIEIDNEMKAINEYFKMEGGAKSSNKYKNVGEKAKEILFHELSAIHEVDSVDYSKIHSAEKKKQKLNSEYIDALQESVSKIFDFNNRDQEEKEVIEEVEDDYGNEFINDEIIEESENKKENEKNRFSNIEITSQGKNPPNVNIQKEIDEKTKDQNNSINEDINEIENKEEEKAVFESGVMESNYLISIKEAEKLTSFLLKSCEIYDDDYIYAQNKILHKRYVPPPDPHHIYEFCANVMIMTKMEKEVIIISLVYIERFIFNTGVLLTPRNWKRLVFTSLLIASKIWDDDSFENNHFAQVFTHLKVGEINLLERTFLELINYKVYIKCSEYFKYFFIIKSIALKYNFNGYNIIPINVEQMMKLQESAYQTQKKLRKYYSHNNSAIF